MFFCRMGLRSLVLVLIVSAASARAKTGQGPAVPMGQGGRASGPGGPGFGSPGFGPGGMHVSGLMLLGIPAVQEELGLSDGAERQT